MDGSSLQGSFSVLAVGYLHLCIRPLCEAASLALTRSLMYLLEIIEELKAREVELRSLRENIDTSTATGRGFFPLWVLFLRWSARLRRNGLLPGKKLLKPGAKQGAFPHQRRSLRAGLHSLSKL